MKVKFKLLPNELLELMACWEQQNTAQAEVLWKAACQRVGAQFETLDDAKSPDPHEFLAEPIAAVPVPEPSEDVRKGATSASNALADSLCPGRHLAQRGIPEPPASEDASTGHRIHAALANKPSGSGDELQKLTLAERDMFDSCREIEKKIAIQFFGDSPQDYRVFRHDRLWLPNSGKPGFLSHSGEPDVVFRAGTKALVADYKVLTGDVADASSNMQLRDLAVLVAGHYAPLDQIATVIIQPLVTHSPEVALYTLPDLERAYGELVARVKASNDPKSPRVAGEVQCKFCRAVGRCKENAVWRAAQLPAVIEPAAQVALFSIPRELWNPEQRALAASVVSPLGKFAEDLKEYLKPLAGEGQIPGWGLTDGRLKTPIVKPQECFDRFAALGGKLPEFLECIEVKKGLFEEALAEVTKEKGKAFKTTLAKVYDGITAEKRDAPSLAKKEVA